MRIDAVLQLIKIGLMTRSAIGISNQHWQSVLAIDIGNRYMTNDESILKQETCVLICFCGFDHTNLN